MRKNEKSRAFTQEEKDAMPMKNDAIDRIGNLKQSNPPKTGMDALNELYEHVTTFGGATKKDNPKQKNINIIEKLKETSPFKDDLKLKKGNSSLKRN